MSIASDFATFRSEVLRWQQRLGLTDWAVKVTHDAKTDKGRAAEISINNDGRRALITFCSNHGSDVSGRVVQTPKQSALHEILHLLLADYAAISARRGNDQNEDVIREEHRVIERLITVMT